MDSVPVSTSAPEVDTPPARLPWTTPQVEDLGNLADLTLQGTSFFCEPTPEIPFC